MADGLNMSRRIRRTPYTDRVEAAGVSGFSVVNHMLLPKAFKASVEEDYWHLREHVQIWDVSCQRQVEIKGPDSARLVQWMTPRNISTANVGDCLYIPIIDDTAGLINDPVLLKLGEEHFWLSIADSDVLLYAKGLAIGAGLEVSIKEPDVSPLAVQGPKAVDLMTDLFGPRIRDLGFFKFGWFDFKGTKQIIARSGYSRQGGYEVYLNESTLGASLWDAVWSAGEPYNISPGCPNLIERIEGGLFSYGNEMTIANNPLEIGMRKFCELDGSIDYIGRKALLQIANEGASRQIRGIIFDGSPCPTCTSLWSVMVGHREVGKITSAIWSPRLKANVGVSLIDAEFCSAGQKVTVISQDQQQRAGEITNFPL